MNARKLIVGLGNPGEQYQFTRHNAGWLFVQQLATSLELPSLRPQSKFSALVTKGHTNGHDVLLACPTTYMNDSGTAVAALVNFYQLDPARDLLLVYDDLDLEFGRYKLTTHGPRTHNGLADVKLQLGIDQFTQLRLGVDDRAGQRQIPPLDYVLMAFSSDQLSQLREQIFPAAIKEVQAWL